MTGRAAQAHHLAGHRAGTLRVPARPASWASAYFSGISGFCGISGFSPAGSEGVRHACRSMSTPAATWSTANQRATLSVVVNAR